MNIIIVNKDINIAEKYQKTIIASDDKYRVNLFDNAFEAYDYLAKNVVDIALIEAELNCIGNLPDGLALAQHIKKTYTKPVVVLCHHDGSYLQEHNELGLEYYLVTPISDDVLISTMTKMGKLVSYRDPRIIVKFNKENMTITKDDTVVDFRGKMKKILEILINKPEVSITNRELFSSVWPDRPYTNDEMKVYYNALNRIRKTLAENNLNHLLISTRHSHTWKNDNTVIRTER